MITTQGHFGSTPLTTTTQRRLRRIQRRSRLYRASLAGVLGLSFIVLPLVVSATDVAASPPGMNSLAAKATSAKGISSRLLTISNLMRPQSARSTASWKLVFDSQFSGTALNATQWSTGWKGSSGITTGADGSIEQECMDPRQVSVAGGALDLTAVAKQESCGGHSEPYASGLVSTYGKFTFTYGYMEARIWLPGTTSLTDWPAFWALGPPNDGEIDVVEGLGGQAWAHFHLLGFAPGSPGKWGGSAYTGGWHTFAADWEPGSITYYYDGIDIGKNTSEVTSDPMDLILDLALSTTITSPNIVPATMQIDYVKVWQH